MTENSTEPLSERELQLVRLLARGLSNKEIARELYISPNTVKVHLRNIYTKLEVSSRTEATMVALRLGWVELDREEEAQVESAVPESSSRTTTPAAQAPAPPLARWQQVYLVVAALVVAAGLWLIWPRPVETSQPFTDLLAPAQQWLPGRRSRWQSLAQMPTPRSRLALVPYDTRVYAIGGESIGGVSSIVEVYSVDADDWVPGSDKPTATANVGGAAVDGRIYVPGGILDDGKMHDQLEVLDPETASWTTGKSLPQGICAYAIAVHEDRIYLFGGWDGVSFLKQVLRYDPIADDWEALSPMPTARAFAGAGTIRSRIYVVGGFDGQDELDTCQVYDPQTDTWAGCPPMNAPRGGIGAATIGDTLYVVGGGWNSYLVENEHFSPDPADPSSGVWRTFPSPLLQEWRNLGVAASETTLYAIGGWDGAYLGVNLAYRALYRLYVPSSMGRPGG